MSDAYEQWLESKAEADVPEGFADRVMASAERAHPAKSVPLWIAAAAATAFLVRVASTLLVFVAG